MFCKTNYKTVLALKYLLLQHGRQEAEEKKIQALKSCRRGNGNSTLIPLTPVKCSVQQLPRLLFSFRKNRSLPLKKCFQFKAIFTPKTEVLFCKPVRPLSHQWHFHINKESKEGTWRNWWEASPGHRSGPSKLHSCGHRPRFSKISRSTGRIASWAILRWGSVSWWHDRGLPQYSHSSQLCLSSPFTTSHQGRVFHSSLFLETLGIPTALKTGLQRRQRIFWEKTFWPSSTPTGAHQDRAESELAPAEPLDTELADFEETEVCWNPEGNFGIHMARMKITPLCTYMQEQCPALTTGTSTELCQQMTQKKRRRRRRWKNRPKKGKAAGRKANKKQQWKQLCSEVSVPNSEIG